MKHSIFWKFALIILPLTLLADTIILTAAYIITYEITMARCRDNVEHAAVVASRYFEMADSNSESDLTLYSESFDELCELMDMTYIYTEIPFPDKGCTKYLSIGYGEDAAPSAKETHYIGYVSDSLYNEEIEAFSENKTTFCYDDNE